jgi:hypothetical protein
VKLSNPFFLSGGQMEKISLYQRLRKFNIQEMAKFIAYISMTAQASPKIENEEEAIAEALKALRIKA